MGMEGLAAPQPEGSATRVLVVEDDRTVSEVVARYLGREGYAVEEVADGSRAVERALQSLPDLVVVDLMIPGLDGLEVCRRLRERSSVPVVMLTALGEEEDRILGLQIGADLGSLVTGEEQAKFTGLIKSVRMYSGQAP